MNVVILMSNTPRVELIEAYFVRWGLAYDRLYRTSLRSVTLGWVYVLWTSASRDDVVDFMTILPLEYMGPWEYIDINEL